MKTYVKKPILIHAFQWNGKRKTLQSNMSAKDINRYIKCIRSSDHALIIKSLEGSEECRVGNMVVEGIHGEYYPCDQKIFKESYREVKKVDQNGHEK